MAAPGKGVPTAPAENKIDLYCSVSNEISQTLISSGKVPANPDLNAKTNVQFLQDFVTSRTPADEKINILDDLKKNFPLQKNKEKKTQRKPREKRKHLTAAEKRRLGLHKLPREGLKYSSFQELHQLWTEYMEGLLELNDNFDMAKQQDHLYGKVAKADYHGCLLLVSKSKCPSYVGVKGIVLVETKNALQIIGEDNKVRTIPKKGSVFNFTLRGILFTIFGNHFNIRPSERASRKLKGRVTVDL